MRLHRDGSALRLAYADTGDFLISEEGWAIQWAPSQGDVRDGTVRLDVLGRTLPLALHRADVLCLHASAVAGADGTLAVLGPKRRGKSSTALRLCRAGARLLASAPPESGRTAVRRKRLRGPRAAVALLSQLKLGPLLQGWAVEELLSGCVRLSRETAVYRIEVPRGPRGLDELENFVRWRHGHVIGRGGETGVQRSASG